MDSKTPMLDVTVHCAVFARQRDDRLTINREMSITYITFRRHVEVVVVVVVVVFIVVIKVVIVVIVVVVVVVIVVAIVVVTVLVIVQ